MKTKLALLLIAAALPSGATVLLNTQFGTAFDSSGVAVADGTLWVLIGNTNGDGSIAGTTINSTLIDTTANTLFTVGQSINLGSVIGGDTVFAMGGFNGAAPGIDASALTLTYGVNATAASQTFAFFWFPGATYGGSDPITSGSSPTVIGSQVGGINTTSADGVFDIGMTLPADGFQGSSGAATSDGGGTIADSAFQAVNLIPEPSAALLGALGALGLLRRRRN